MGRYIAGDGYESSPRKVRDIADRVADMSPQQRIDRLWELRQQGLAECGVGQERVVLALLAGFVLGAVFVVVAGVVRLAL